MREFKGKNIEKAAQKYMELNIEINSMKRRFAELREQILKAAKNESFTVGIYAVDVKMVISEIIDRKAVECIIGDRIKECLKPRTSVRLKVVTKSNFRRAA